MRNKNKNLCAVGALEMYLLARFEFGAENIDWTTNGSWFDVKLLVDKNTSDNTNTVFLTD